MLGGNGVAHEWPDAPYPWVANAAVVLDAVERLLHEPPQRLPPGIRDGFETWLAPENMDDEGRQRRSLGGLTGEARR
jgi:hypothetical protein